MTGRQENLGAWQDVRGAWDVCGFAYKVNPQENLKEIRKYLKKIPCLCVYTYLPVCGHMSVYVCGG